MTGLSMSTWPALAIHFERVSTSRWIPLAATLLALALLGYSLAQWSWRFLTPPEQPAPPPAVTASPQNNNATQLRDVLAANLFGVVAIKGGSYSADNLPITSLNLVLTGVMVRGPGSYALIRVDGGDETPVSIGQEIQAGARLHAVYADRVVLDRGGSYESLLLKDLAPSLPPGSIVGNKPSSSGGPGLVTANGNQFRVNRESLQQQVQRPDFLNQALIVPNSGGGFLVREVQPGSVYEKLGVRAGDVIRNVNGQPVNNLEDVMKIYQEMGGLDQAGHIMLDVSRAGRTEQLQYDLN